MASIEYRRDRQLVNAHPCMAKHKSNDRSRREESMKRHIPGTRLHWQDVLALLVLLLTTPALGLAREKSDIVTLRNGDRITGEVVGMQYGILQLKTDDIGTINIEWPSVRTIETKFSYYVERTGNRHYFGHIGTAEGELTVDDDPGPVSIPMTDVARMSQVESGFWARINGSLAIGYQFTKSNDVSISSLSFQSDYRSPHIEASLNASALSTKTPEDGTSDRDQIASSVRFVGAKKNFWMLLGSLDRNEELGIEGRVQVGAAVGRHFFQTSFTELTGIAGLSFNQEWASGQEGGQQSLEGVIGGEWRVFRFSDPETNIDASLLGYPSLTESGRYRTEANVTFSREIINDLTLDLTYYNSYDSDPPDETANRYDYGVVTSLGYKF